METLEKILEATVEKPNHGEVWMKDETMNELLKEAKSVRVEANLLKMNINGYEIIVNSNAGKLYDMSTGKCCYYQLEAVNGLYKKEESNNAVIL